MESGNPRAIVHRWYAMEPRASVSISLPISLIRKVEDFARAFGLTRSGAVAYLVHQGLARHREMVAAAALKELEGEK